MKSYDHHFFLTDSKTKELLPLCESRIGKAYWTDYAQRKLKEAPPRPKACKKSATIRDLIQLTLSLHLIVC